MNPDRLFRARRAAQEFVHRAICIPDDHGWLCIALIFVCGGVGYAYGLATR